MELSEKDKEKLIAQREAALEKSREYWASVSPKTVIDSTDKAKRPRKYQQFDRTTAPKEQQQDPEEKRQSIADRFRKYYPDGIRY
jgi:hypothetical protein